MNFTQNLLLRLLSGLNLWQVILFVYRTSGRSAVIRMLTPPESFVRATTKATGADFDTAMKQRREAAEEVVEFVESLVDKDFQDDVSENEVL